MKKESQSIFWQGPGTEVQQNSLLNFLTGIVLKKNQIGDKEANMLYRFWKQQTRKKKGELMAVPDSFSVADLAILKEKNLIKGDGSFVTITDDGARLIKKIILTSEKNTFEYPDQDEKEFISMDSVRKRLHASKVATKKKKCASKEKEEREDIPSLTDYLYKAIKIYEKAES